MSFLPDPEQNLNLEEAPGEIAPEVGGKNDLPLSKQVDLVDPSKQVDLVDPSNQVDQVGKLREKETKLERKYNLRTRREEANTSNCTSKKQVDSFHTLKGP